MRLRPTQRRVALGVSPSAQQRVDECRRLERREVVGALTESDELHRHAELLLHAKHDAARNDRLQEAEAYTEQINSIENRAEMIRRCFVLVLISLAGSIAACLLLGFGVYWRGAAFAAAAVFVVALISLFAGTIYYIREVMVALSSVHQEARDSRFMDLGAPPEVRHHSP